MTENYFSYNSLGFTIKSNPKNIAVEWSAIECILAYKLDRLTVDDCCLDIYTLAGKITHIEEDIPGFWKFVDELLKRYSSDPDLYEKLVKPPFAFNLTLVYDAHGRSLEEITRIYGL